MTVIWMALAGGLGSVLRFVLDGWIASKNRTSLPLGTLTINILGSLFLGIVVGLAASNPALSDLKLVLGTGLAGGFTTFSTASVEAANLARAGGTRGIIRAALLAGAMLVVSMAAALLALSLF